MNWPHSRHPRIACVQCHTGGTPSDVRACNTIKDKVDCSICHDKEVAQYRESTHGTLAAQGSPDAPALPGLPQPARHPGQARFRLADVLAQRPRAVRQMPPGRAQGRRSLHRQAGPHRGALPREHPRHRGCCEAGLTVTANCADCHTAAPRTARQRPTLQREPRQHRRNLRASATAASTSCSPPASTAPNVTHSGKPLPVCADCHSAHSIERTDLSDFRLNIMDQCGRCHQADHRELFRDVPRQGLQAGIPEDRQVLRLSRRARHSAGERSALASQPDQHRRHLRQVPHRLPPPVRRLSDARHPPRSEEVSFPVLHLLGHDHPADRHAGGLRRAHRALAAPVVRIPQADRSNGHAGSRNLCAPLPALPSQPSPDGGLQFPRTRADRHDSEVLLCRLGQGAGPPAGRFRSGRPDPPVLRRA